MFIARPKSKECQHALVNPYWDSARSHPVGAISNFGSVSRYCDSVNRYFANINSYCGSEIPHCADKTCNCDSETPYYADANSSCDVEPCYCDSVLPYCANTLKNEVSCREILQKQGLFIFYYIEYKLFIGAVFVGSFAQFLSYPSFVLKTILY